MYAKEKNTPTRRPLLDTLHRRCLRLAREVPGKSVTCSIPLPFMRMGTEDCTREPTVVPDQAAGNKRRAQAL